MPYIYSEAGHVSLDSDTLLRPLVMDFRQDPKAVDTWDQFMFGKAIMVCPVLESCRMDIGKKASLWSDSDGNTGGVTQSITTERGGWSSSREEIQDGFRGEINVTKEVGIGDRDRMETRFLAPESGSAFLEINTPTEDSVKLLIDGLETAVPRTQGIFDDRLVPLKLRQGVSTSIVVESPAQADHELRPALRIIGPQAPTHQQRKVYFPTGTAWYDFWTGERKEGGEESEVPTVIEHIPLYVRAGSILPLGPDLQWSEEKAPDPIELRIYKGADGTIALYEDEGDNYGYEKGAWSEIPITWNDRAGVLTLGERRGTFPGMLGKRTFRLVVVRPGIGGGVDVSKKAT